MFSGQPLWLTYLYLFDVPRSVIQSITKQAMEELMAEKSRAITHLERQLDQVQHRPQMMTMVVGHCGGDGLDIGDASRRPRLTIL